MTEPLNWRRLLAPEGIDSGCEGAFEVMDVYAEHLAAGGTPWVTYPRMAAHLRSCDACEEDLNGLVGIIVSS